MNIMSETHGTRTRYNAGCRCTDCRSANNTYIAKYQRRRVKAYSAPARRATRRWEPWEDDLVSDYSKSAWQVAGMLERTPSAVINRRHVLHARAINQKEEDR